MNRHWIAVIMFGAIVLQATVVPFAGTALVRPHLPLLIVILLATRRGAYEAVLWAMAAGYLTDLLAATPLGYSALGMVVAGFIAGKYFVSDTALPFGFWVLASGSSMLAGAVVWAVVLAVGTLAPFHEVLLLQTLPSAAYTWGLGLVWAISPWYPRRRGVHLD